jgi:hypothetical protein
MPKVRKDHTCEFPAVPAALEKKKKFNFFDSVFSIALILGLCYIAIKLAISIMS